jgi:hypothetical protein
MAGGRPAKFNTPDEMQAAIDVYFAECDPHPIKVQFERTNRKTKLVEVKTETRLSHPIPYTMTGLARALGFESRSSFRDYKRRGKFSLTVKQAKMKIEEQLEVRMLTSNGVVAGIIFNAKNNFDWKDKQEQEITGPNGTPLMPISLDNVILSRMKQGGSSPRRSTEDS